MGKSHADTAAVKTIPPRRMKRRGSPSYFANPPANSTPRGNPIRAINMRRVKTRPRSQGIGAMYKPYSAGNPPNRSCHKGEGHRKKRPGAKVDRRHGQPGPQEEEEQPEKAESFHQLSHPRLFSLRVSSLRPGERKERRPDSAIIANRVPSSTRQGYFLLPRGRYLLV